MVTCVQNPLLLIRTSSLVPSYDPLSVIVAIEYNIHPPGSHLISIGLSCESTLASLFARLCVYNTRSLAMMSMGTTMQLTAVELSRSFSPSTLSPSLSLSLLIPPLLVEGGLLVLCFVRWGEKGNKRTSIHPTTVLVLH